MGKENGAEGIRINKLLSSMGICSRREADRLISEGRISINGRPAEAGMRIGTEDVLELDGRQLDRDIDIKPVILAYNKPRGVVCTSSKKDRAKTISELVDYESRVYPIGRLDKDSEGLILLTNMGDLVNRINRSENGHEKEYEVELERPVSHDFAKRLMDGVIIDVPERGRLKVAAKRACLLDEKRLSIVLTEGMNRQIRRMCGALGGKVVRLRRLRVMNIRLGDLGVGTWRKVRGRELEEFFSKLDILGEDGYTKKINLRRQSLPDTEES